MPIYSDWLGGVLLGPMLFILHQCCGRLAASYTCVPTVLHQTPQPEGVKQSELFQKTTADNMYIKDMPMHLLPFLFYWWLHWWNKISWKTIYCKSMQNKNIHDGKINNKNNNGSWVFRSSPHNTYRKEVPCNLNLSTIQALLMLAEKDR